jgi:light-regulated signal transduction histidine kinase (bacteriophytochrome)
MPPAGARDFRPGLARFVHQLTHDLRNDLAAVEVFATTAAGSGDAALVGDALSEISATVAACGRRLAALRAAACLEFPAPQMVQMGVAGWMDGIRKHVEMHAASPFVAWRFEDASEGVLRSDPLLLAGILDELLANALRCAGGASKTPSIEVALLASADSVFVEIRQPIVERAAVNDVANLDFIHLQAPALSSTKHHYGFGLSAAALRAESIGAELSVSVDAVGGGVSWFTAMLKLPLTV